MTGNILESIQSIPLADIDSEDRFFAVSLPWFPVESLQRSIENQGLLAPLHVQRVGKSRFRLVIGFRRHQAVANLGWKTVPCVVRNEGDGAGLFVQGLEDNQVTRPLHLLEKAQALLKLRHQFGLSLETLRREFAGALNIKTDRYHVQRCLDLAKLPTRVQKGIYLGRLEPDIALQLSKWMAPEQEFFMTISSAYKLGLNKQRQLFDLLDELRSLNQVHSFSSNSETRTPLDSIWRKSGADVIEQNEQPPSPHRFGKIFERLRQLRYPHLVDYEGRYVSLKSALKLPPNVQFQAPRHFEGDRIDISFSFRRPEQLLEVAKSLEETAKKEELVQILDLL